MKIFFDTNVYVAEALVVGTAARLVNATLKGRWRIYASTELLDEVVEVIERLGFSKRFALLLRRRVVNRSTLVKPVPSRHQVPDDPKDGRVLRAALAAGADLLVTNDRHVLSLDPYEGLKIISMTAYFQILESEGLLT